LETLLPDALLMLHFQKIAADTAKKNFTLRGLIDWCCFYYFTRNSLVALLEDLFTRIFLERLNNSEPNILRWFLLRWWKNYESVYLSSSSRPRIRKSLLTLNTEMLVPACCSPCHVSVTRTQHQMKWKWNRVLSAPCNVFQFISIHGTSTHHFQNKPNDATILQFRDSIYCTLRVCNLKRGSYSEHHSPVCCSTATGPALRGEASRVNRVPSLLRGCKLNIVLSWICIGQPRLCQSPVAMLWAMEPLGIVHWTFWRFFLWWRQFME